MIPQQPLKQATANSELFESLAHRSAGLILPDKVKRVRYFTFSGHVYDFQTANGLILADGIITHNCRSTLVALTRSQADKRSGGKSGLNQPSPRDAPPPGWGYKPNTAGIKKSFKDQFKERMDKAPSWIQRIIKLIFGWLI